MPFPIRTPRVNNNDDTVRLSAIIAQPGAKVSVGDLVAEVETDKATFSVEADRAGYFIKSLHNVGDTLEVGSVLAWMGETADETVDEPVTAGAGSNGKHSAEPTLRAALLLREYGLEASQVRASGERLSVSDVEAHVASLGLTRKVARSGSHADAAPTKRTLPLPEVQASISDMDVMERGMLRTVSWHRDEAVTGYVEIAYDAKEWENYGASFQKEHKLLLNPMMSLMAYQLVALRGQNPKYNATVQGEKKVIYEPVNIGFTVQSGSTLYLTVVANAEQMTPKEFVQRLLELQKAAMKNKLQPSESSGATISFTSMARWGATRHQPILPPYTSLMIAHAAASNGISALGATYDHRILTGGDVVTALNFLKSPA